MRQKFTVESVLECPNLPGLPTVAMEVISLTREEDVNLREVASRVELDPALTARVLRTVNSAYFGLGKPVASIQRGIGYMGFNALVSLILGFSLVDMTRRRQDHFDFVGFWRRSTTAAATARRIAMRIADRVPEHHELTDEAFAAGLLQDIGMLPLQAADPERFRNAEQLAGNDHRILGGYEREAFGFDHATVGAALARRWRLPESIIESIAHHHDGKSTDHPFVSRISFLASEIASAMLGPNISQELERAARLADGLFNIDEDQFRILIQEVTADAEEVARFFDVEQVDLQRVVQEAEQTAMQLQIDNRRREKQLEEQRDALVEEMSVDGLTGIYNRRFFDDQLHERFEQARRFRGTLGLLMIDVDHFKSINDDHGHPVGDLVLKECAARMGQIMRRGDVLCRYGGEEFVVLLPGATKREIATVAERLRIRVEDEPFLRTLGDESPIAVTISVGGALATPDQDSTEPCDLLHAADGALYQAKREGRNQSCFVVADRMRQQDAA